MIVVAVALVRRGGRLFLQRRAADNRSMAGLWELPGGKLEDGEGPQQALLRELQEELHWTPTAIEALPTLMHAYPDRSVGLHPFACEGPGRLHCALSWGWFLPTEALRLDLPAATRELLLRGGG